MVQLIETFYDVLGLGNAEGVEQWRKESAMEHGLLSAIEHGRTDDYYTYRDFEERMFARQRREKEFGKKMGLSREVPWPGRAEESC